MQSVPILAAAAAFAAITVYLSRQVRPWWRPAFLVAAGFAPLPLLTLLVSLAVGAWREASIGYISGNARYSRSTANFFGDLPALAATVGSTPEMQFLLIILLTLVVITAYAELRGEREPELLRFAGRATVAAAAFAALVWLKTLAEAHTPPTSTAVMALVLLGIAAFLAFQDARAFGIFSLVLLAAALSAIYLSPQKFPHYMELLIVPISTLIAWLLIRQGRRLTTALIALALILVAESTLWNRAHLNLWEAHETMAYPGGTLIRSLTRPDSRIVVWGWRPELYLSAGRLPATRESNLFFYNGFDAGRVLRDLQRTRPDLIVDAIDVSCCNIDNRARYGFEAAPSVDSYIHANYTLVDEKYREKFYLRKDLPLP
jgi:hypothetical protein